MYKTTEMIYDYYSNKYRNEYRKENSKVKGVFSYDKSRITVYEANEKYAGIQR